MTLTEAHSVTHRAICDAARQNGFVPFDVRVLLAIAERGGSARSDELETDLCQSGGSGIRRSIGVLRRRSMVTGGNVRGQRTCIALTDLGQALADAVVRYRAELVVGQPHNPVMTQEAA